ncbi:MAG: DinB family protein, partial [Methylocella sp.]
MTARPGEEDLARQTEATIEVPAGGEANMARLSSAFPAALRAPCSLSRRLFETRRLSLDLARPLSADDMTVQAMDDASPTKWHLAHTTWFFETFVLASHLNGYQPFDETFNYCFNSYYESQGPRQPRGKRGLLTRPSSDRIFAYRAHVDAGLEKILSGNVVPGSELARGIEVGINHEQ